MRAANLMVLVGSILLVVAGVNCAAEEEKGAPQTTPATAVGEGSPQATPTTAVGEGSPQTTPATAVGEGVEAPTTVLGIDADPSSTPENTATSLGSIETCVSVTTGDSFDIDVFVDAVPTERDLAGFDYFLKYDNTKLQITAVNHNMLLASQPGSTLIEGGETVMPDTNGSLSVSVADVKFAAVEPGGSVGVLGRYGLQAVGSGLSTLRLEPAPTYLTDSSPAGYMPGQVVEATIAIDQSCPASTTTR